MHQSITHIAGEIELAYIYTLVLRCNDKPHKMKRGSPTGGIWKSLDRHDPLRTHGLTCSIYRGISVLLGRERPNEYIVSKDKEASAIHNFG